MTEAVIDKIIGNLNGIVASEGGRVVLLDHGEDPSQVHVRYEMQKNESCDACTITPEMLEQFLRESLRTHGFKTDQIIVETGNQ